MRRRRRSLVNTAAANTPHDPGLQSHAPTSANQSRNRDPANPTHVAARGSAPHLTPRYRTRTTTTGRPASAPQYNPAHVGNDASARPWESDATRFEPAAPTPASPSGIRIGAGLASGSWSIPAGFDAEGFVAAARNNFVVLQEAWDKGDIPTLRSMMTDEMVGEIRSQLAEREAHRGPGPNQTDVVMLEAQLLGVEDLGHGYLASVEFSGLIREEPSAGPSPFREVWNMTRTKDGGDGWLVAGVQALQ
jgi:predicted lipid-binding transport protein (Tim44 family)